MTAAENDESSSSTVESSSSHINALTLIGLSQYESKCFLASLQKGPSTVNQIGIVAGVPRTKVYGAVRRLVERGLLEQNPENPKILVARSPKEFLIPILEREERRIRKGLSSLSELEEIYESMKFVKGDMAQASQQPTGILRLSPRSSLAKKTREVLAASSQRVFVFTTAQGLIRFSKMASILFERASERAVKVEIVSPALDEPIFSTAVQSLKEIPGCGIRIVAKTVMPIELIIVDSREILFSEPKPDDYRDSGMDVGFYMQNSEMADMFEGFVRTLEAMQATLPFAESTTATTL